jgi:hypothetical protein
VVSAGGASAVVVSAGTPSAAEDEVGVSAGGASAALDSAGGASAGGGGGAPASSSGGAGTKLDMKVSSRVVEVCVRRRRTYAAASNPIFPAAPPTTLVPSVLFSVC